MLPLLFLYNNKKSWPYFFQPDFVSHILDPIFFQGRKPTHVFTFRIVGADWLGNCEKYNNTFMVEITTKNIWI